MAVIAIGISLINSFVLLALSKTVIRLIKHEESRIEEEQKIWYETQASYVDNVPNNPRSSMKITHVE